MYVDIQKKNGGCLSDECYAPLHKLTGILKASMKEALKSLPPEFTAE